MYTCTRCRNVFKRTPALINKFNMPIRFYVSNPLVTYVTKTCRKCKNKTYTLVLNQCEQIPYDGTAPMLENRGWIEDRGWVENSINRNINRNRINRSWLENRGLGD